MATGQAQTLPWSRRMEARPHYLSISGSGLVYVGSQDSNTLEALSADTGVTLWKKNLDAPMWGEAVVQGGSLMIAPKDQALVGLRPESGEALWWLRPRFPTLQSLSGFTTTNLNRAPAVPWKKSSLFLSLRGVLSQLDPDGKLLKQQRLPRGDQFWARPALTSSSMFAATRRGEVVQLSLDDWKLQSFEALLPSHPRFPGGAEVLADLCAWRDRVFVATVDGTLYCRGDANWSRPLGNGLDTLNEQARALFRPSCDETGRVCVAHGNTLVCLGADQGQEIWRFRSAARFSGPPVVQGEKVWITTRAPALLTLSMETGRLLATQALPAPACSAPLPYQDTVILGLENSLLIRE